MTDAEEFGDEGEFAYQQPALVLRFMYDDLGRVNAVAAEYQEVPAAEDLARVVAQFLTIRPVGLPNRVPGANLPRDPRLDREFRAVLGICGATANVLNPATGSVHDTHMCVKDSADHGGARHCCECGTSFGG